MAKRRPSGDGMVRKREDGRWEAPHVAAGKKTVRPSSSTPMLIHKKN